MVIDGVEWPGSNERKVMDVNQATEQATERMHEASEAASRMGEGAKQKLSEVSKKAMERSKVAATHTDAYVHEYAWSSIALAALLGVAIGLMIRR
jgi:ElaB/YqjD/DUF883 family membrane-anchored ribosome-binding protein